MDFYVITEPCIAVCDTACVKICPVDCIHGPLTEAQIEAIPEPARRTKLAGIQLYIDPDSCINCGLCVPECPVNAIYEADNVPAQWHSFIARNAAFFRR